MNVRRINKIVLWIIVGFTLVALLALNVLEQVRYSDVVTIASLTAIVVWLLVTAICSQFKR